MSGHDDDLRRLWQGQETQPAALPPGEVRAKAGKFQRQIRRRNALEYLAGAVVVGWLGAFALRGGAPLAMRVGALATVVGVAVVLTNLWLRGHAAAREPAPSSPTSEVIAWHREELVRQRDLLRRVAVWYLGPMIPGMVVFLVGGAIGRPGGWMAALPAMLLCAAVFTGVWWLNRRAAAKLDRQIDELAAAEPPADRGPG